MDLRTPNRMALSEAAPGLFSTPLSSPPSNIAPPSSPLGTATNAHILEHMEVDSDIDTEVDSADIFEAGSGESERDDENTEPDYRSTQEKLQAIANLLRQYRWTFKDFLQAWVQEADNYGQEITLDHRGFRTTQRRRKVLLAAVDSPSIQQVLAGSTTSALLLTEFGNLIRTRYFGKFESTEDLESIDFTAAFQAVQDYAPTWHRILIGLLRNRRANWSSYSAMPQDSTLQKRLYMVTSIVCHSHAKKQSNFLPSVLDMYLLGSGVKRRVVESLSGLGICHSYMEANRRVKAVADRAKVRSL
jgi:hypothetical protein